MTTENENNCIDKDDLINNTTLNIDKFGLQVIMVGSTSYNPSFAYSIGLTQTYKHAEIICFGLPNDLGHAIINDLAEIIKKGEKIDTGKIYTEIFQDSRAAFIKVDKRNIADYFGAALNYYGDKGFDALQVVWTDRNDKFPWEDTFEEEFLYKQPLLDRNKDFKFYESRNLTTFTTRQWLDEKKPILRVVHDSDGDWQFLTGDQFPEDIKIVALEELIKRDSTLNDVFDLEYGEEAERDFIGGQWIIKKFEPDDED
ncbi:DUF4262 domain-containing protein [Arcticibacter eurypsychrophilus]|uniref:DUF4262 domain-containing protein n=1 Tax=Arcticibacter eurypsychrophilus TaxID=1434752 RepID=UPI00084D051C|nr:DUF4262 domain-containing protein [Arcticibacter eurypsychrophilus]